MSHCRGALRWTQGREPVESVEPQRAQRIAFFVCRETTTNKNLSAFRQNLLPNRRLPIGQKFFPLRTLRLCGGMFECLSARIGENLRLKFLCTLGFGAIHIVGVVLLKILWVRAKGTD
jgi:hypothetical protein